MRFNNGFKMNTSRKQFKMKKEKGERRLKWWHILLIVLGVLIIAAAITAGIIIGKLNNITSGNEGGTSAENLETQGTIASEGTFIPDGTGTFVLCEYTDYFSNEKTTFLSKASDVPHSYKPYYVLVSPDGTFNYKYSGEFKESYSHEEIKAQLLSLIQSKFHYTDEEMAEYGVKILTPVTFTQVKISKATVKDGSVTLKYQAGAVDGELSEEYTLSGTYVQTGNDFAFTYTNLPEDAHLLCVAEKVLASAKYEYYAQYGAWVNTLTFADSYTLFLQVEE